MFCNFKLADFLGWVCATNLSYHSPARLLSQVTNTLYSAGSDIFHFMLVLMTIFFSYAIAGVFLLGLPKSRNPLHFDTIEGRRNSVPILEADS